ncbi:hypothetical protein V8F06_007420 [Rhypophila decipiens]
MRYQSRFVDIFFLPCLSFLLPSHLLHRYLFAPMTFFISALELHVGLALVAAMLRHPSFEHLRLLHQAGVVHVASQSTCHRSFVDFSMCWTACKSIMALL